jgi:hypothetical protein
MPTPNQLRSLAAHVRLLVGEAGLDNGAEAALTDEMILLALGNHRERVRYEPLVAHPTIGPGGARSYREWTSAAGFLADGATLVDLAYNVLPDVAFASADPLRGEWVLSEDRGLTLYLVGDRYDVFLAAADTLAMLRARYKAQVDASEVGASYKFSQALDRMEELEKRYRRASAGIGNVPFGRCDIL